MTPTWKAAIGVILVFILGWVGGVVTTLVIAKHKAQALAQHSPEAIAIVLERQTTRDLGLNEDQKVHLHALFVQNVQQRLELQKQIQPQVHTINRQTLQQIDAVLTTDQQQRFHDNLVLFKDRFGRNPFSVGPEDRSVPTTASSTVGTNLAVPATNAPVGSK